MALARFTEAQFANSTYSQFFFPKTHHRQEGGKAKLKMSFKYASMATAN